MLLTLSTFFIKDLILTVLYQRWFSYATSTVWFRPMEWERCWSLFRENHMPAMLDEKCEQFIQENRFICDNNLEKHFIASVDLLIFLISRFFVCLFLMENKDFCQVLSCGTIDSKYRRDLVLLWYLQFFWMEGVFIFTKWAQTDGSTGVNRSRASQMFEFVSFNLFRTIFGNYVKSFTWKWEHNAHSFTGVLLDKKIFLYQNLYGKSSSFCQNFYKM